MTTVSSFRVRENFSSAHVTITELLVSFLDAGIDLQQLQQLESGRERRDNKLPIPLNSPSTQLGKGVKRLELSSSKFRTEMINFNLILCMLTP